MELPIQLKFFKKIELFQEYKFQQRKASGTVLQAWHIEKRILRWTTYNHHHLGSLLKKEDIKRRMLSDQDPNGLNYALENLVQRGYATGTPNAGVIITKEGLLMGEVINDLEGFNRWHRIKYGLWYALVWATAISGALIVIIKFFMMVTR